MPPSWALPVVAFITALGLAKLFGADVHGTRHALDVTARYAYLWFWLAYAGCPLACLLGRKFHYGREWGLAFAAAHSVHVMLVLWLYWISTTPIPFFGINGALMGSIGITFMYILTILSIKRLAQMLSPWVWRSIIVIGMEYIAVVFFSDFWVNSAHQPPLKKAFAYMPFIILGILGTSLRLLNWGRQLKFGSVSV